MNPLEKNPSLDGLALAQAALSSVSGDLEILKQTIPELIPCETEQSRRMVDYVFSASGKMIRPALYYLCCRLVGYLGPHRHLMAAVSEFVHTASLLHDDVVDASTLRRNRPTSHSIWGDSSAVLFGDLVYSRASELMTETGSLEIVSSFARAIRLMSESELVQLDSVFRYDLPEDTYFKILYGKTAVLIGSSCKSAGLLANCTSEQVKALDEFGVNIGIAFQLVDDALDFMGEPTLLGKKNFADLQGGKITLPILLLKKYISPSEDLALRSLYSQEGFSLSELRFIQNMVGKYNTAEETMSRSHDLTRRSLDVLQTVFPPSQERTDLVNLARGLCFRHF